MHQCIKFILFLNDTLHVSDGLSVHHQEFKTTYSNRHCQTDTSVCLLASTQHYLFDSDDGRKDRPKHIECRFKIK